MVALLVKKLELKDKKVCVISRGYGRKSNKTIVVDNKKEYPLNEIGDEPFTLLREHPNLSMVISNNKIEAINMAIDKLDINVIILDDGFQSLYIKRDLDIVMTAPKGYCINSITREPSSALRRADAIIEKSIIKSGGDQNKFFCNLKLDNLLVPLFRAMGFFTLEDGLGVVIGEKKLGSMIGVCGIANPNSFKETLSPGGAMENIPVKKILTYKDHHNYSEKDMQHIYKKMEKHDCKSIITTTKDYYKLIKLNKENIKIYKLKFEFDLNLFEDAMLELNKENNPSGGLLGQLLDRAISNDP